MKTKLTATILSALLSLSALACDATKAVNGSLDITLQPGVPQVITFDFSDCGFGINNDSFYVTKPRNNSGQQNGLPSNTPLTVTLYDVTTGQYYPGIFIFYCINNCQSVCGHVLQLTLTLSASAHKPLDVEITQIPGWGGACQ